MSILPKLDFMHCSTTYVDAAYTVTDGVTWSVGPSFVCSLSSVMTVSPATRAQLLLRWATVWPQYTWAEEWGGGCCAPFRGGVGFASNTTLPGPRPTSVPSGILIHPTVCPQYTNFTDGETGQRSHCIGRTLTCNGRPKTAEPIEMSFGMWTRVGPGKHVLDGIAHRRHLANTI